MPVRVLQFYTTYKKIGDQVKEIDRVVYAPLHAILTTQNDAAISALKPRDPLDPDSEHSKAQYARWSAIEPAYAAWKSGNEIPENGTPLSAWSALSQSQVDALKGHAIRTVEDLAGLPDGGLSKFMLPNMRELRSQAQLFLQAADQTSAAQSMSHLQSQVEAAQSESAEMRKQLDDALRMLNELTSPPPGSSRKTRASQTEDNEASMAA